MSTVDYRAAPWSVDVLPSRVHRRWTRRDAVLPGVLALELGVGMLFGLVWQASDTPAPQPQVLRPAAAVSALPSPAPPRYGPVVGPLLPGTVRRPAPERVPAVTVPAVPGPMVTVQRHAPRNPFGVLVH